eukprot:10727956-Alexandrium_andersonii.AAC.1
MSHGSAARASAVGDRTRGRPGLHVCGRHRPSHTAVFDQCAPTRYGCITCIQHSPARVLHPRRP